MAIKPIGDKPTRPAARKHERKIADKGFGDFLLKSGKSRDEDRMQNLFEGIENAAGILIDSRNAEALKEYRRRIKEFLTEVLERSREIKIIYRETVYDDPLVIVKIVDDKLDELAAVVIREEVERGDTSRIIDEIKGIIVDMYR